MSSWATDMTSRVGVEIKRLRGKRSAQWLSDRTAELGYPVPRTTISETETGRRRGTLPVQELVVLAAALQVPPLQLLYPGLPSAPVEYLPGGSVRAIDAAQMFAGELPQPGSGDESIDVMAMARRWAEATADRGQAARKLLDEPDIRDAPEETRVELFRRAKDVEIAERSMRQADYPFYWGVSAEQMNGDDDG
ncbi:MULTISPECIES: hypothetical protein [Gordonia]|uniref:hypothetical protein n=1 Tax=Gordonia TaxID=2053 RepID=UPI003394126E